MSNYSTPESCRRSTRQRKLQSALELLGIERKKTRKTVNRVMETAVKRSKILFTNDCEPCLSNNKLALECTNRMSNNVCSQLVESTFSIDQANIAGIEKCSSSPLSCSMSVKSEMELANDGQNEVCDGPVLECSINLVCENQLQVSNKSTIAVNVEDKFDTWKPLTLISDAAHESHITKLSSVPQGLSIPCFQICDEGITSCSGKKLATLDHFICTVNG